MIQVLTDQHQLILSRTIVPFFVIQREPLAAEMENVTFGAFVKPEDTFCSENRCRQLVVEEILEFLDRKGLFAFKRN